MITKTDIELTQEVRDLLAKGWCQHDVAQDDEGNQVDCVTDANATKFCLFGACERVDKNNDTPNYIYNIINNHIESIFNGKIYGIQYNDSSGRTKKEVLSLLDKVILQMEKGE